MENKFMRVEEVAEVLEVSTSFAYKVIRQLNDELKAKGFITIAGRINREYQKLTSLAKRSYSAESEVRKLQDQNRYLSRQIWSLQSEVSRLKEALSELTEKCRPYLEALKAAPKAVKEFIDGILERFKKQEKSIMYEPIPAPKNQPQERGQRSKNRNYER